MVRETGGLRDTVLSYNELNGAGNGFTFFNYNAHDMLYTLRRAVYFYRHQPDVWALLQRRAMTGDYSWAHSAEMYLSLYQDMLNGPAAPESAPQPQPEPAPEAPAKKPRGRKPKTEEPKKPEEAPAEKKPRGRKSKAAAPAQEQPAEPVKKPRGRRPKAEKTKE